MIGVLNTRPLQPASTLSRKLREAGFNPIEIPLVELEIHDGAFAALEAASVDCDGYLLSSPTLFPALLSHASESLRRHLKDKPWYLVSAAAKAQVEAAGAVVAFVPRRPSLAGFLDEFPDAPGLRLIHPGSESSRLDPEAFQSRGISVRHFNVYAPRCPNGAPQALEAAWSSIQAILFASGSAVQNLFTAVPARAAALGRPGNPYPISTGPSSSQALRQRGVEEFREAGSSGDEGLIQALRTIFPNTRNA